MSWLGQRTLPSWELPAIILCPTISLQTIALPLVFNPMIQNIYLPVSSEEMFPLLIKFTKRTAITNKPVHLGAEKQRENGLLAWCLRRR
ncbi:hypothetical protein K435DRAFT_880873 [Dendrothele bispora CBS 962.96]|uniref:Uncharacterized protein n=1 Tax=Dendrothele bispora (strain CBS 962.96) TaxID=1314807 RepID=A0A4S8KIX7_DENBC|nr:hypothetical protein K435DRAFT_880873 [Dendrothele bispora CBS 962.96]